MKLRMELTENPKSEYRNLKWFDEPFGRPFDRLTVLSKVEGLTTLSQVEGESSESDELRHSLLRGEGSCRYPAEQKKANHTVFLFDRGLPLVVAWS